MTITIDTREPYEKVSDYLIARDFFDFDYEALNGPEHPKTDYVIDGDDNEVLAVQRKEVNDFVSSIGNLKDELHRMRKAEAHTMSCLLIEGNWAISNRNIGLRRGKSMTETVSIDVWHRFIASQQDRGTFYIRTTSLKETAHVLQSFHGWIGQMQTPPVNHVSDPGTILQLVPGIGPSTAEALVGDDDGFGSAYEALLHIGEWEDVPGIGPKKQERAIQFFKEERLND